MKSNVLAQAAQKAIGSNVKHDVAANVDHREFVGQKNAERPDQRVTLVIGGGASAGSVYGEQFIAEVQKGQGKLLALLRNVYGLNKEGHAAFQASIAAARQAANLYWKGRDAKPATAKNEAIQAVRPGIKAGSKMDALAGYATRSAFTRMSEATSYSKACVGGFSPDFALSYGFVIASAKAYLKAHGQGGGTGPAAKTPVQKAVAYLKGLKWADAAGNEHVGLTKAQLRKAFEEVLA